MIVCKDHVPEFHKPANEVPCPYCTIATLQKDNDNLKAEVVLFREAIKTGTTLQEALEAEVEKKDNLLLLSKSVFTQECDRSHGLGESIEKAEIEVKKLSGRLRRRGHKYEKLSKERDRLRDGMKKHTVDFFYWWYNQPGTNTDKGYDAYIETLE